MKLRSLFVLPVLALAACGEHTSAPSTPASIRVVVGESQSGVVGRALPTSPTIVVADARGNALAGVAMTVTVVAGAGTITNAPTKTGSGATSVGTWTLGPKTGEQRIQVEVPGVSPLLIAANANAGPATKLTPANAQSFTARVGDVIRPAPAVVVSDAFDNPIAGVSINVAVSNGGSIPTNPLVSDASGRVDVGSWMVGTTSGQQSMTLTAGTLTATFTANVLPAEPAQVAIVSGNNQTVFAGGATPVPIVVRVADRFGNGVADQDALVTVTGGGGAIATPAMRSDADGLIRISSWRVGRSAVPQSLHVASGAFSADVGATIKSDFNIDVRFFGPDMTPDQKALFTNAAARIRAIISGDIPDETLSNVALAPNCGMSGLPTISETIDDVVIYATVRPIDGTKNILARSGPCILRQPTQGYLPLVGVMEFDSADLALMTANGYLQDVITHEMLHVIGVGTLWSMHDLVAFAGTTQVGFVGAASQQACIDSGGWKACEANVPVENVGGPGTADVHWRESVFGNELMTGYVNLGGMPLSAMTVESLHDLGYTVNALGADPFQLSTMSPSMTLIPGPTSPAWEARPPMSVSDGKGGTRPVRP